MGIRNFARNWTIRRNWTIQGNWTFSHNFYPHNFSSHNFLLILHQDWVDVEK
ncbi:MAG TPA: hypothetical protein VN670_08780 [Acidobacteriaceae bacterium]|nr:hypothetical protein [Acidobacteriaceae bacterium]